MHALPGLGALQLRPLPGSPATAPPNCNACSNNSPLSTSLRSSLLMHASTADVATLHAACFTVSRHFLHNALTLHEYSKWPCCLYPIKSTTVVGIERLGDVSMWMFQVL